MTPLLPRLILASLLFGAVMVSRAGPPQTTSIPQQILVMLHLPAPHYRPGTNYAGAYVDTSGQRARKRVATAIASRFGLTLVDNWPMPALGVDCFVMQLQPGQKTSDVIHRVSRDKRVDWAQPVQSFRAMNLDDPLYATQPAATRWHLRELHRVTTGRNVRVAVIDSGVDAQHPDLGGQIIEWRNFVDSRAHVAESHGTEVAGIIAAREGNGIGITGVAPGSKLLALRACWQTAQQATSCNTFTLAKALQFAIDTHAQIINMSLAGPDDPLLSRFLDIALDDRMTVVAAIDPDMPGGGFPASHPGVVAVSDQRPGSPAPSRNRAGSHMQLFAPGRDIPTTTPDNGWNFVSGPSFATANVTGLIALIRQVAPDARMSDTGSWSLFPLSSGRELAGTIDACATLRAHSPASSCFHASDQAMRGSW